ncbi:MAG: hypothetical protein GX587_03530, partial [Bacteroidales bacterium]|nr:hypothetical protein [Bacteroidales bacterium]
MRIKKTFSGIVILLVIAVLSVFSAFSGRFVYSRPLSFNPETIQSIASPGNLTDTIDKGSGVPLKFSFEETEDFQYDDPSKSHPLYLKNPSNIKTEIIYNPEANEFMQVQKVGDRIIKRPAILSFEEYKDIDMDRMMQSYWREKTRGQGSDKQGGIIPQIYVGGEVFDRIFGGSTIDIRPTGSAELSFGVRSIKRLDPALDEKRQKQTNFNFDQQIQLSVLAKIGDKIEVNANYNTEATF